MFRIRVRDGNWHRKDDPLVVLVMMGMVVMILSAGGGCGNGGRWRKIMGWGLAPTE